MLLMHFKEGFWPSSDFDLIIVLFVRNDIALFQFSLSQVIFEAIPKDETDQARRYRGYIALDDVNFKSGSNCRGHCTFDAGLCGFKNSDRADFDWKVVSELSSQSLGLGS